MVTTRAALAAALVLGACHHAKPVTTPVASAPPPAATQAQKPAQQQLPASTNLGVNDELARQCKLHVSDNVEQAPKFSFDNAELTATDRDVLQQIATCVTTGPLKGRALALTGRADPRGTEEYNLGLGDRRAHTVSTYLERLGVLASAIHASTRGALDAHGTDESSWQADRRVDIGLD